MGSNDWVKFVADFNLGVSALVVFDTSKRTAEAYVAHLGFAHLANDGDPGEDIVANEDEVGEGAGVEVFNIESDEEVLNDDHEKADARELVYTHGCVLSDAEGSLLDVVLTNNDGYIGSSLIHRLTTTNISKKTMKIPRKVVEQVNLPPVGVAGICIGAGECMNVAYHTDCDGRMVFTNQWGVFATQTNLQEGDAIVFSFKPSNAGDMNIICVVHILRMPTE
uniref:TF-B3 domain-containing protein n=1 Tax=Hordeum vulgare subsp. vulgare TaxID=112509 RepID=A0A8I6ZFT5_HORVV